MGFLAGLNDAQRRAVDVARQEHYPALGENLVVESGSLEQNCSACAGRVCARCADHTNAMPRPVVALQQRIRHRFGTAQQQRSAGLGIHKQFQQCLVILGINAATFASKAHLRGLVLAGIEQRPGPAVGWRQAARVLLFQEL